MKNPIEHKEHTPKERLQLLLLKKLVAVLNLLVSLGHITLEELDDRLANMLEKHPRNVELWQYSSYLLEHSIGSGYASDYMEQLEAETEILTRSSSVSLEPSELPDALRYSTLERAEWELKVLENQLEKEFPDSHREFQLLCVMRLVIVLNMEVDLGCIQEDDCGSRLEAELEKPGYCAEARQYLQEMLYELTDDETSNYWGLAQGRRSEMESELFGDGFTEPSKPTDPKEDPRYPALEEMRRELEVLQAQLEATWAT